jgi:hypothetical protein
VIAMVDNQEISKRIERIKKDYLLRELSGSIFRNKKNIDFGDLIWLVEIVEQLQKENKKLLEYAIDTRDGVEYWNSKYRDSEQKIEMAIEKIDELPFSTRLEIDEITKVLKGESE